MTANAAIANRSARAAPWLWAAGYVAAFVLLDWASYIRPLQGLNITPWNPQPALAIALLIFEPRRWWLVWLGLLAAEVAVRGIPADWPGTLAATAALALAYAAIARALSSRTAGRVAPSTLADLLWFTTICIGGALLSGVVYVSALTAAGLGPSGPVLEAFARYWVGDGVGLLVTLPILLMVIDPARRATVIEALRSRDWWAIASLVLVLLYVVFQQNQDYHFRFFYLLLLPAVWAAARFGLAGAALSAVWIQLGLIVALRAVVHSDLTVFELQVLMAALTMTGLILGIVVDERARAALELRGSLRLAAAGQMAAAIAHELGQPLTALSSYARALQVLLERGEGLAPAEAQRVSDIARRIVADTHRAADVVGRLRDFFRSGTTQFDTVSPAAVIREAVDGQRRRAAELGVQIEAAFEEGALPDVSLDAVQIGVVLRNLIGNAVDAAAGGNEAGRVVVAACADAAELLVEVVDNGPGLPPSRLSSLFEAGPSEKPGGMGVGLSLCRAIVDAHGGRLWAAAGPGGRFCFRLPLAAGAAGGDAHAP